uniref:Si:ch73-233k15.2 n=1 Tax=Sinocyclocheilus grahami TaxID=75366 RepID=A0A672PX02_SINGR
QNAHSCFVLRHRAQLEERLTEYVKDTLSYIETVRDFCDQEPTWTSERKAERDKLRGISENQQEKEEKKKKEELSAVLKDTLEGLKKLEPFLDAVEKLLAVTSSRVFNEQIFLLQGESPERVQSVIKDARRDAPLLIHFKRNAESFFQPLLQNVNILVFQLNILYICFSFKFEMKNDNNYTEILYRYKMGQPSVQLILNASENAMNQMLHHLDQLREIRMNQDTRLAFLFQENAQKFIDVFGEHRSKMWQFLSHLEETADKLDSMKKGASISTVAGSSVGILGGALSLIGIVFALFTGGASLFVTAAGAGLGGISAVNSIVTGITETKVNQHQERNAQSYLKSYKDDMIKIEDCLKEAANSEGPLVKPSAVTKTILTNIGEGLKESLNVVDAAAAIRVHKSENVTAAATKIAMRELDTASDVPQVAIQLSGTRQLATTVKVVKGISSVVNLFYSYLIAEESKSLAKGSESEVSKLIRSRAALWKSELEAWEKMHKSLSIGIKTISESKHTLKKQFLP